MLKSGQLRQQYRNAIALINGFLGSGTSSPAPIRAGETSTSAATLEQALIIRLGILGPGTETVLAALRQWSGVYQPRLYAPCTQLRSEAEVHPASLPATERNGGTRDPHEILDQHLGNLAIDLRRPLREQYCASIALKARCIPCA